MRAVPALACDPFAFVRAHELEDRPEDQSFDIEDFWAASGVGVLGGLAKSTKSWVVLDMAISVASGTPCLGRFAVKRPGPTMVYAAEDPPAEVRKRLAGLAQHRGLALADVPVHVITEPAIRLDQPTHRERLRQTLARVKPRMLILDPLVRVYGRLDENSAAEVSDLLGYLRALQREFDMSLVVVHHARKAQGAVHQAGEALRGSGDFFAWSDTLLYTRRIKEGVLLTRAHRSAPSGDPLVIQLVKKPDTPVHLEVVRTSTQGGAPSVDQRILHFLARRPGPASTEEIREALSLRKERVIDALEKLQEAGRVRRQSRRWCLASPDTEAIESLNG